MRALVMADGIHVRETVEREKDETKKNGNWALFHPVTIGVSPFVYRLTGVPAKFAIDSR